MKADEIKPMITDLAITSSSNGFIAKKAIKKYPVLIQASAFKKASPGAAVDA